MLFFSGSKHRKFLSTPSARRATAAFSAWPAGMSISIHALREEGDNRGAVHDVDFQKFLSTPSARRATKVSTTR